MAPKSIQFLIIDDMASVRFLLKKDLKAMGFTKQPLEAGGVQEALTTLESKLGSGTPVEFILSDYNMSEKTGLDLFVILQKDPRFSSIPFLLVTSENEDEVRAEATSIGLKDYLIKPWTEEDLTRKIELCWDAFREKDIPITG